MMYWRLVDKSQTQQPPGTYYWEWKQALAEEGGNQCVYCALDDETGGGPRTYHVEHYRPKSLPRFYGLKHDMRNLFYACCICNGFKGNDWKDNDPHPLVVCGYPDPSKIDFSTIYSVDASTGTVNGIVEAGKYMAIRLYLNRPQLLSYRRQRAIGQIMEEARAQLRVQTQELWKIASSGGVDAWPLLEEAMNALNNVLDSKAQLERTSPYTTDQVKRVQG